MREREQGLRIEESDSESESEREKRLNCLNLIFVLQWGRIWREFICKTPTQSDLT
jgi:hypothetical protein